MIDGLNSLNKSEKSNSRVKTDINLVWQERNTQLHRMLKLSVFS